MRRAPELPVLESSDQQRMEMPALPNAITRASQSLKGLDWRDDRGARPGERRRGNQFQVKVEVGFRIMSETEMQGA